MAAAVTVVHSSLGRDRGSRSGLLSLHFFLLALTVLVIFWGVGFFLLARSLHQEYHEVAPVHHSRRKEFVAEHQITPKLLSRNTTFVKSVTADVRGNLGPAEVVVKGGNDWLNDRWQAASDMHGKNIPGRHWIIMEFTEPIVISKIVLDWETAYCNEYVVEGSMEAIFDDGENHYDMITLFDGRKAQDQAIRSEQKYGQSPGVKQKMPLHIVHTIPVAPQSRPVKFLRLLILKSVTGWGVSLWLWDVYGVLERDLIM
jgi:hypothetical protein